MLFFDYLEIVSILHIINSLTPTTLFAVGLIACFEKFGSLKIEWPGKDDRHNRHPPKGLCLRHQENKSQKVMFIFHVDAVCRKTTFSRSLN